MMDIYEALKSGKSAEDIANEFVNELNANVKKVNEEKAAADAAAKLEANRNKDATAVADHLNNFISIYFPDKAVRFTAKDVIALCDATVMVETVSKELDNCEDLNAALDTWQKAIQDFFKTNGI